MTPTDLLVLIVLLGEWTGLARALLGAPIYAGALDLALLALTAYVGVRSWRTHSRPRWRPLDLLVIAYVLLAAAEVFNPNVPGALVGLEGFRKTAFTTLAYVVVRLASEGDPVRFYRWFALGSVPAFMWSLRQFVEPLSVDLQIVTSAGVSPISFHSGSVLRAFSPTSGPFHLGVVAGSALVVAVVLSGVRSFRWVVVAVAAAMALGLSLTRANILATSLAVGVVVLLGQRIKQRRLAFAGAAAVAVVLIAMTAGMAHLRSPRAASPPAATSASPPAATSASPPAATSASPPAATPKPGMALEIPNPFNDRSLQYRFAYWAEYLKAIGARPLTGYGTSSAADGFDRLYAGTSSINFEPHSVYFKAALELGIVGLGLLLALLLSALVETLRVRERDPGLSLTALGILIILMVSGTTGPMLDAYPFNLLLWGTVGWAATVVSRPGHP